MIMMSWLLVTLVSVMIQGYFGTAKAQNLFDHDFDRGCTTCHTPRSENGSLPGADNFPKWGPKDLDTTSFNAYILTEYKDAVGPSPGPTIICLTCHDGTAKVMDLRDLEPNGLRRKGSEIGKSHPVAVPYDSTKPGYADQGAVEMAGLKLFQGPISTAQVECSTCHDVHNKHTTSDGKYLRVPKAEICSVCHQK